MTSDAKRGVFKPLQWIIAFAVFAALWLIATASLLGSFVHSDDVRTQLELASMTLLILAALLVMYRLARWDQAAPPRLPKDLPDRPSGRRVAGIIALLWLSVPGMLLVAGALRAPWLERDAYREIESTATLQSQQLAAWVEERSDDGGTLTDDPGFREAVSRAAAGNNAALRRLSDRLEPFRRSYGYSMVEVVTPGGSRIVVSGADPLAGPHDDAQSTQPIHTHFHGDDALVTFTTPVPHASKPDASPQAWLRLGIRARQFLFPYVAGQSRTTETGESLIAVASGDEVQFLTPLRHTAAEPGTIRRRKSDTLLPAAIAIASDTGGRVAGYDYRGVPVLAVHSPIPGTDWRLIVKRDRAEVFAPLAVLLAWIAVVSASFAALTSVVFLRLWRNQQQVATLSVDAERRRGDRLVEQFLALPFVGVARLSPERGHPIVQCNDALCQMLGYEAGGLLNSSWDALSHSDDTAEFARMRRAEIDRFQRDKTLRRRDGEELIASVDAHCVRDDDSGVREIFVMIQDISERKRFEDHIQTLTRLYAALSQTNQAIVHSTSEDAMCEAVCRSAVDFAGFPAAVVAMIDRTTDTLEPRAWAAEGKTGRPAALSLDDDTHARHATVRAARAGKPVWGDHRPADAGIATANTPGPDTPPFPEPNVALPIVYKDHTVGVFALVAADDILDDAARDLLTEMAADLGFGLEAFDRDRQRRQAEERLQRVITGSRDAPWDWDIEGDALWFSSHWSRILGYADDEIPHTGQVLRELAHPDDIAALEQHLAALARPGTDWESAECRLRHRDGHYVPTLIRAWATRGADGRLVRLSGTVMDLTERMRIEQELRDQRDALQHAQQVVESHLENTPLAVVELDADMRITRWSGQATALLGWSPQEALGQRPDEIGMIHPDDIQTFTGTQKQLRDQAQCVVASVRNITLDSDIRQVEWYVSGRYDAQGNLESTLSLGLDVTEKRRTEAELAAREQLLSGVIEFLPVGVWITDALGNAIRTNDAGEKIWGRRLTLTPAEFDELKARRLPERSPVTPDNWAILRTLNDGNPVHNELLEIDAFDGVQRIVLNSTVAVRDAEGTIVAGVVTNIDVTERERAAQEAREQLDELNRWQTATIGRELRLAELKREINQLLTQSGKPPRYQNVMTSDPQDETSP